MSANQPSSQRLIAQITTIMCYNIDKIGHLMVGVLPDTTENTPERFGKRHVRDQEYW